MQVTVKIDEQKMAEVRRLLARIPGGLPRAMAGAVNDTGRKTVTRMSTAIRRQVNIKKKDIDPHLKRTRATPARPSAHITLSESARLPLKYFGARQTKRGVSYSIAKGGGRKNIPGAFGPNIARLGGHVYKRAGAARLPIVKLRGPSPWGVFVKAGMESPTEREATDELERAIDGRVRFLLLKASGSIR